MNNNLLVYSISEYIIIMKTYVLRGFGRTPWKSLEILWFINIITYNYHYIIYRICLSHSHFIIHV